MEEPDRLLTLLGEVGVSMVCTTAGSPYHCPHAQRPAYFPPSDGYLPPQDPLFDVVRLLDATAGLKASHPDLVFVGSGYSYLQEWLPNVAQADVRVREGRCCGHREDGAQLPRPSRRRRRGPGAGSGDGVCRTFSDCTTAPRNGLVSGCYPLDAHYKEDAGEGGADAGEAG